MGKPNLYIAEVTVLRFKWCYFLILQVTLYEIKNYTEIELDVYRGDSLSVHNSIFQSINFFSRNFWLSVGEF